MKFGNVEIRFVFGILPAIFLYSPGKQSGVGANTKYNVIRFQSDLNIPEHRIEALRRHELEHVKQFYMTFGLSEILYQKSPKYRLWAEAKAHRVQAVHVQLADGDAGFFVWAVEHLRTHYDLDITEDEAWDAIGEPLDLSNHPDFVVEEDQ